uniref:Uncharacterized protein n=1 Tax=Arundo donax TaxID=35708 RepID=A0A0A8Z178_ARUDO
MLYHRIMSSGSSIMSEVRHLPQAPACISDALIHTLQSLHIRVPSV